MKRARRVKRAAKKPVPIIMSQHDVARIQVMETRLTRANDVLNCLDACARLDAEVNLGALAVAARDIIDKVLEDLSAFNRGVRGLIATIQGHNNV